MAKGQSELVGLAVVVVLIVIGLMIAVSFALRSTDVSYSIEHQNDQLPVYLNDAILESHVGPECYQEQMKKLILKAAQNEPFFCINTPVKTFVQQEIQEILDETLDSWYVQYQYTIYTGLDYTDTSKYVFDVFTNTDCTNKNIETENFFFSMPNGDFLNMKLDICYE